MIKIKLRAKALGYNFLGKKHSEKNLWAKVKARMPVSSMGQGDGF